MIIAENGAICQTHVILSSSFTMRHLVIVGSGVMGSILFSLVQHIRPKIRITICTRDTKGARHLARAGALVTNKSEVLHEADIIILAVKPKDFVASDFVAKPSALVISVMAGVSITAIRKKLGVSQVARIMTNTAAEFGKGYAVWTAPKCTQAELAFVRALCISCGKERKVEDEADIDRATIILGSGPAFLLRAFEDFTAAARSLGISEDEAKNMSESVLEALYALSTRERDTKALISRIASKGGTTEAGLNVFAEASTPRIWRKAFRTAYSRARALRKLTSV